LTFTPAWPPVPGSHVSLLPPAVIMPYPLVGLSASPPRALSPSGLYSGSNTNPDRILVDSWGGALVLLPRLDSRPGEPPCCLYLRPFLFSRTVSFSADVPNACNFPVVVALPSFPNVRPVPLSHVSLWFYNQHPSPDANILLFALYFAALRWRSPDVRTGTSPQ